MTIPITLNVKESAYDKIIYFLSHLKDDVTIVNKIKKSNKINVNKKSSSEKLQQIKILERLATLDRLVAQSNNKVMLTRDIAIDTDGMSDDISRY